MRTAQCSTTTGVYRSDCGCRLDVEIHRGDDAPPCPRCRQAVAWTFLRGTFRPPAGTDDPPASRSRALSASQPPGPLPPRA